MRFILRLTFSASICWVACVLGGLSPCNVGAEQPNIVIILADDMGYGDVQAINPTSTIPTPHLNQLAAQGMTFLDAHSPSGVCTPTRYGLLTGRYCWRTRLKKGVLGGYSKPLIETGRSTIASMLKNAGYQTAAIGKWHLGMDMPLLADDAKIQSWEGDPGIDFAGIITDSPIHHGFDYYFGVSASLDMAPYVYIRNDRFTKLPSEQQPEVPFPHFVREGPRADDFVIDAVLDRLVVEATAFIDRASKSDKPFFLYMPLTAPHKPTQPKAEFRGKTGLGEYGDFIAQVDDAVGRVLAAIDGARVTKNTLVVFTSDNGSYMHRYEEPEKRDHTDDERVQGYRAENHRANGPLRGTKADIYEAGHRVPFFVRWPGQIAPESKCNQTICHVDLFATCADVVGAKPGPDDAEDSLSVVDMLNGKSVERAVPVIHHSSAGMFAVRDGRWKLVLGNGSGGRAKPSGKPFEAPYQLFDVSTDIGETKNVLGQHPEIMKRLVDEFKKICPDEASRIAEPSPPSSNSDGRLVNRIDLESEPSVVWQFESEAIFNDLLFNRNAVVASTFGGTVSGLNVDTGREIWSEQIGFVYGLANSSADSSVILVAFENGLLALNPHNGEEKWILDSERPLACPVCDDHVVYAGGHDGKLYAIDANNGKILWTHNFLMDRPNDPKGFDGARARLEGQLARPRAISIDDRFVYLSIFDQCRVIAVNRKTGKRQWSFQAQGWVGSRPQVLDDSVLFGSQDQHLYCLDKKTGSLNWKFKTGGRVSGRLTTDSNHVYFGSSDSYFYCVDIDMGYELWKLATDKDVNGRAAFYPQPLVTNEMVMVPAMEGQLYGISAKDGELKWKMRLAKDSSITGESQDGGSRIFLISRQAYGKSDPEHGLRPLPTGTNAIFAVEFAKK